MLICKALWTLLRGGFNAYVRSSLCFQVWNYLGWGCHMHARAARHTQEPDQAECCVALSIGASVSPPRRVPWEFVGCLAIQETDDRDQVLKRSIAVWRTPLPSADGFAICSVNYSSTSLRQQSSIVTTSQPCTYWITQFIIAAPSMSSSTSICAREGGSL
jgi:hypothetical protein